MEEVSNMVYAVCDGTGLGAHDFSGGGSEALRSSSTYEGLRGGDEAGKEKEGREGRDLSVGED